MNTTHKWNSYNDYSYQYYQENESIYKKSNVENEELQDVVIKAKDYQTNFLNLPADYKLGR